MSPGNGLARCVLAGALFVAPACASQRDAQVTAEFSEPQGLSYAIVVDSTRLRRGMNLAAVPAVTNLIDDDLSAFFRVTTKGPQTEQRAELFGEAAAPGYGVRAIIEARPDDYCLVTLDVVKDKGDGTFELSQLAPYSLHFAVSAVRVGVSALHGVNRPQLTSEQFELLRTQAAEYASRDADPPIDEMTFAHTPRPLDRSDLPPRYFVPDTPPSVFRLEPQ